MANNSMIMGNKEWPKAGDLITCADFEFGRKGYSKGAIDVNSIQRYSFPVGYVDHCPHCGNGTISKSRDDGVRNPSWATAIFQVTEAKWAGGSTGRDPYPDGWCVKAVRLDENMQPTEDRISFIRKDTGCFNSECTIEPSHIKLVPQTKTMQMIKLKAQIAAAQAELDKLEG